MLLVAFTACSSGFSQKEADGLLQKDKLTSDEYDRLLELYETAIDDAIEFSKKEPGEMSEKEREEVKSMFMIGIRLNKDEGRLSEDQKGTLDEINRKGTEELKK